MAIRQDDSIENLLITVDNINNRKDLREHMLTTFIKEDCKKNIDILLKK
jgi:hypothetical protein